MLYVGLDLSRKRFDFDALPADGERFERGRFPRSGRGFAGRLGDADEPVLATIESMNGARFIHGQLELAGGDVRIPDAYKVKGFAPLAWLGRLSLVPEIWLAEPACKTDKIDSRASVRQSVSRPACAWSGTAGR